MEKRLANLKEKLEALQSDWLRLAQDHTLADNADFLTQAAQDIQAVDQAALISKEEDELQEEIELLDFVLTTPWGAPFVGHDTLLEAAQKENQQPLKELAKAFTHYEKHFHSQILCIIEDVLQMLKNKEKQS